jgi:signal peptidase I
MNDEQKYLNTAIELLHHSGEDVWMPVKGTSMLPMLRVGDRVKVQRVDGDLQLGDIVVFRQGSELIIHRVLGFRRNQWYTRGDNVMHFDPPISTDDILGRVSELERRGKHYNLTTRVWRWLGWMIAWWGSITLPTWSRLRHWKLRRIGEEPLWISRTLRAVRRLVLDYAFRIFGRVRKS